MPALAQTAIADLVSIVRQAAIPLATLEDEEAFAKQFDRFGDARVVLLGEASHGTAEFYRARAAISRRLIERCGFRIVAIEGDWPDAGELDRFVRKHGKWGERSAFVNFPRWMWRNEQFADFVRSIRRWNDRRPHDDPLQ
jgi:erythromycin esterase-like protein